jgi:hypothetical protein
MATIIPNTFGFITAVSVTIGLFMLFRSYKSQYFSPISSESSLFHRETLKIKQYDDYRGESRNFLFRDQNLLTNYIKGYNMNLLTNTDYLEADRDYNGLNNIKYNITKYDIIQQ